MLTVLGGVDVAEVFAPPRVGNTTAQPATAGTPPTAVGVLNATFSLDVAGRHLRNQDFVLSVANSSGECSNIATEWSSFSDHPFYSLNATSTATGFVVFDTALYAYAARHPSGVVLCQGVRPLRLRPVPNVVLHAVGIAAVNDSTPTPDSTVALPAFVDTSIWLNLTWETTVASPELQLWVWAAFSCSTPPTTYISAVYSTANTVVEVPVLGSGTQRACYTVGAVPPVQHVEYLPPGGSVWVALMRVETIGAQYAALTAYRARDVTWDVVGHSLHFAPLYLTLVQHKRHCGDVSRPLWHTPILLTPQSTVTLPSKIMGAGVWHICLGVGRAHGEANSVYGHNWHQHGGPLISPPSGAYLTTAFAMNVVGVDVVNGAGTPVDLAVSRTAPAMLSFAGVGLDAVPPLFVALVMGSGCGTGVVFSTQIAPDILLPETTTSSLTADMYSVCGGFNDSANARFPFTLGATIFAGSATVHRIAGRASGARIYLLRHSRHSLDTEGINLPAVHLSLQSGVDACSGKVDIVSSSTPVSAASSLLNTASFTTVQTQKEGVFRVCVASTEKVALAAASFSAYTGLEVAVVEITALGNEGAKQMTLFEHTAPYGVGVRFSEAYFAGTERPSLYLQPRAAGSICSAGDSGAVHPGYPAVRSSVAQSDVFTFFPPSGWTNVTGVYRLCASLDGRSFDHGPTAFVYTLQVFRIWGYKHTVNPTEVYILYDTGGGAPQTAVQVSASLPVGRRIYAGVAPGGNCSVEGVAKVSVVGANNAWVVPEERLPDHPAAVCVSQGNVYQNAILGDEIYVSRGSGLWVPAIVTGGFTSAGALPALAVGEGVVGEYPLVRLPLFQTALTVRTVRIVSVHTTIGPGEVLLPRTVTVTVTLRGIAFLRGAITFFLSTTTCSSATLLSPNAILHSDTHATFTLLGTSHTANFISYRLCSRLANGVDGVWDTQYRLTVVKVGPGFALPTPTVSVVKVVQVFPKGEISDVKGNVTLSASLALMDAAGERAGVVFEGKIEWSIVWLHSGGRPLQRMALSSTTTELVIDKPFATLRYGATYSVSVVVKYTPAPIQAVSKDVLLLHTVAAPSVVLMVTPDVVAFGVRLIEFDACRSGGDVFTFYSLDSTQCGERCRGEEGYFDASGADYRGVAANTASGVPCVEWRDAPTHQKLSGAFCRNPDRGRAAAWCYTAQGVSEVCALPPVCWCSPVRSAINSTSCSGSVQLDLPRGISRLGVCVKSVLSGAERCVEHPIDASSAPATIAGAGAALAYLEQNASALSSTAQGALFTEAVTLLEGGTGGGATPAWRATQKRALAAALGQVARTTAMGPAVLARIAVAVTTPPGEVLPDTAGLVLDAIATVGGRGASGGAAAAGGAFLGAIGRVGQAVGGYPQSKRGAVVAKLAAAIRSVVGAVAATAREAEVLNTQVFRSELYDVTWAQAVQGAPFTIPNQVLIPSAVGVQVANLSTYPVMVIAWHSNPYAMVTPITHPMGGALEVVVGAMQAGDVCVAPVEMVMQGGATAGGGRRLLQMPQDIVVPNNEELEYGLAPVAVPMEYSPFLEGTTVAVVGALGASGGVFLVVSAVLHARHRTRLASLVLACFFVSVVGLGASIGVALKDSSIGEPPAPHLTNQTYSTMRYEGLSPACLRWNPAGSLWERDGCEMHVDNSNIVCSCTTVGPVSLGRFDTYMPLRDPVWMRLHHLSVDDTNPTHATAIMLGAVLGASCLLAGLGALVDMRKKRRYDAWVRDPAHCTLPRRPWERTSLQWLRTGRWGWLFSIGAEPWENPSSPSGVAVATTQLLIAVCVILAFEVSVGSVAGAVGVLVFSGPAVQYLFSSSPHACYPLAPTDDAFPACLAAPQSLPQLDDTRPSMLPIHWWAAAEVEKRRGELRAALLCAIGASARETGRRAPSLAAQYCLDDLAERPSPLSPDLDPLTPLATSPLEKSLHPSVILNVAGAATAPGAPAWHIVWASAVVSVKRRQVRLAVALFRCALVRYNADYDLVLPTDVELAALETFSAPHEVGPVVLLCFGYWQACHPTTPLWDAYRAAWKASWKVFAEDVATVLCGEVREADVDTQDIVDNVNSEASSRYSESTSSKVGASGDSGMMRVESASFSSDASSSSGHTPVRPKGRPSAHNLRRRSSHANSCGVLRVESASFSQDDEVVEPSVVPVYVPTKPVGSRPGQRLSKRNSLNASGLARRQEMLQQRSSEAGIIETYFTSLLEWCAVHGSSAGFCRHRSTDTDTPYDCTPNEALASGANQTYAIHIHPGERRVFVVSHRTQAKRYESGSFCHPFRQDWQARVAPGDSVQLAPGEFGHLAIDFSGDEDAWLALRGCVGTRVRTLCASGCSYVTIEGCTVRDVDLASSHHIKVDCTAAVSDFHSVVLGGVCASLAHRWFAVGYAVNVALSLWCALFALYYAPEASSVAAVFQYASVALAVDLLLHPLHAFFAARYAKQKPLRPGGDEPLNASVCD